MHIIKELPQDSQKYLKATSVASYSSDIAYETPRWSFGKRIHLKDSWNLLLKKTRYVFGEYAISNAFILAFVAKTRSRAAKTSVGYTTPVDRIQFAFNWMCALIALICLLPLMGLVALAIKLDSTGPILYKQQRVGINRRRQNRRTSGDDLLHCRRQGVDRRNENSFGKPFMVYKFRTMVVDAVKRCGPVWATKNDSRITRLGRFLRRVRLDELPQLLNVIKGEMSLVGPRPERPHFIQQLTRQIDSYSCRLEVLPGITGLAQVERGYDETIEDVRSKVDCDLRYIRSRSIRKDLSIMVRTIGVVLGCRGM
jgi:lipopolysaccharide/colanic/teichoic acid biosynthesis glycosyltransferase